MHVFNATGMQLLQPFPVDVAHVCQESVKVITVLL